MGSRRGPILFDVWLVLARRSTFRHCGTTRSLHVRNHTRTVYGTVYGLVYTPASELIPVLWYHQVSQKGLTIAVNYWHDMAFDHRYVYYKLCRGIMEERAALERAGGAQCEVPGPSGKPACGQ